MDRRSELVSQWRDRLASAEHLAEAGPQFRWIHLARMRLYRFLLSCYGSGQWREDSLDAMRLPSDSADGNLSLEGKPAKSIGKIQAALKAVHTAQDHAPPVGPLTGGLDPETYVAVTDSDARINVDQCEQFLLRCGFHPRVVGRGRRLTVEVPYRELRKAQALVESRREQLRPRLITSIDKLRHRPPLPEETQMLFVGLLLLAPVASIFVLTLGVLLLGDQLLILGLPGLGGLFLGVFMVVVQVTLLCYFLAPRWRTKFSLATRRRIATAVCWLCVGVPAALVFFAAACAYPESPYIKSLTSTPAILAIMVTLIFVISIFGDRVLRR